VSRQIFVITIICLAGFAFNCKREERGFRVQPSSAARINANTISDLYAAKSMSTPPPPVKNEYEENAYALSQGKRLFSSFNCTGCHAHGGGSIGPPLMDEKWIYGSRPEQIFSTIVEGRPNGMPSFRGKIPDYQIWQIAAYVRSLSGQVPKDAAPARDDDMQIKPPENSTPTLKPENSSPPPQ
jgi:cytochrome c oxidase cbb3-type subunit 3